MYITSECIYCFWHVREYSVYRAIQIFRYISYSLFHCIPQYKKVHTVIMPKTYRTVSYRTENLIIYGMIRSIYHFSILLSTPACHLSLDRMYIITLLF